jgi:hypothetical protein
VTQRRWLAFCNPRLRELISKKLGSDAWIKDLNLLQVPARALALAACPCPACLPAAAAGAGIGTPPGRPRHQLVGC